MKRLWQKIEHKKKIKFTLASLLMVAITATVTPITIINSSFQTTPQIAFQTFSSHYNKDNNIECEEIGEESVTCVSNNITIENESKNLLSLSETKALTVWFENNMFFGPEVTGIEKIVLSTENCEVRQELNCSAVTNFYDSKATVIKLFLNNIISNGVNLNKRTTRVLTFKDLTYFLAHEYYHHASESVFFDLSSNGRSVDGAGNILEGENYAFAVEREENTVKNFLTVNNLNNNEGNILGVNSTKCPLEPRTTRNIYMTANSLSEGECEFTLTFPQRTEKIVKNKMPSISNILYPTGLDSCGYLSGTKMDWGSLQYYLNIDEIIVRQLVLMTYVDPSSKISDTSSINCYSPIFKESTAIGAPNQFLYDYYILSTLNLLPFQKQLDFDYDNSTTEEKELQDSLKENYFNTYKDIFFRTNSEIGYFFYNTNNKQFSIGGYLDFDSTNEKFSVIEEGSKWEVEKFVMQEDDGTNHYLNIYPKGQIKKVSSFNATNPTTRQYDSEKEVNILNRKGYITDNFKPQTKKYKLFFLGKREGAIKMIPINKVKNDIVRINKGEINKRRQAFIEKNGDNVYASF